MNAWELIIQQPVINVLIVMSHYLGDNFGLAIIALTVFINLCMFPLTLKQLKSTKALQSLQPRMAELQQKYGKDKQKLGQEQMKLYKESGVKPAGCAITMVVQMPVWIALYQSIMLTLAVAPEGLLNLSKYLYSWPVVYSLIPLSRDFLGLNLAEPNFILAILVGASMWLQQKMSMTTSSDPKQRQQTQMMLYMMPLMFTFLALSFPSGLALFWVASSVARVAIQYKITGWGGLGGGEAKDVPKDKKRVGFTTRSEEKSTDEVGADIVITDTQEKPSKSRYLPGRDRSRRRKK
ncbi:YidC/Oxa1 family membrane protein insertase [Chloroflexota bacterium]